MKEEIALQCKVRSVMELLTEYDFEVGANLFDKRQNLVTEVALQFSNHLAKYDSRFSNKASEDSVLVAADTLGHFKLHVMMQLGGRNASIYFHKHSVGSVIIQPEGKTPRNWKTCVKYDDMEYISSLKVRTKLSVALGQAFDSYVGSGHYKEAYKSGLIKGMKLNYANLLCISSAYGDISIQFCPAFVIAGRAKDWFLNDYTCVPSLLVASDRRICGNDPEMTWSLEFNDHQQLMSQNYRRLIILVMIFANKFNLKILNRTFIMQLIYNANDDRVGGKEYSLDFTSFLDKTKAMLEKHFVQDHHVKKIYNILQFEEGRDFLKCLATIRKYITNLKGSYRLT